jgi:type I restriction enzyme S subunit
MANNGSEHWPAFTLTEVFEIRSGLSKPASEFGSGFPFVTFKDVLDNSFLPETLGSLVRSSEKERELCSVRRGDVFLTRTSETQDDLGMSSVALRDYDDATFNGFTKRLRPIEPGKVVPEYAAYYLRSPRFRAAMSAFSSLSTRASLNNDMLGRLQIVLPDVKTQEEIGYTLRSLDDKIEQNRRTGRKLEELARAVFKAWFVDFEPVKAKAAGATAFPGMAPQAFASLPTRLINSPLGLGPRGWEVTAIGDEFDFQVGFAFKSAQFTDDPSHVRLVRGDNVKEATLEWGSKTRRWSEITEKISRYELAAGDVVIGMDGSKLGKNWSRIGAVDLPCLLVQRVARFRATGAAGQGLLWLLISDPKFREFIDAVKTGTSIPHVSGGQLRSFPFLRPDDDNVVRGFEELVGPLLTMADHLKAESAKLATLRDYLLPRLLSGRVQVQNSLPGRMDCSTSADRQRPLTTS